MSVSAIMPKATQKKSLEERLGFLAERRAIMHRGLPLDTGMGLEMSPNWAPLVTKNEGNVQYCDHISYEELVEREKSNPSMIKHDLYVMPLDFQLREGHSLKECAGGQTYDYIVSSHVMEHIPDFLGALCDQREALNEGGVISLVLPNSRGSGEHFRQETKAADLLDAYLFGYTRPTPGMVYEARKHIFPFKNNVSYEGKKLSDFDPYFGHEICFNDAFRALSEYQDAHCWAFSTQTFVDVMSELREGGYFNFEITELSEGERNATGHSEEFYVKLRPTAAHGTNFPRPRGLQSPTDRASDKDRIRALEEQIRMMRASTSWKITEPLRRLRNVLR